MEEMDHFSLEQFNRGLWRHLDKLTVPFRQETAQRRYYWDEDRREFMPLPPVPYEYMERAGRPKCPRITMFSSTTLIAA